MFDDRYNGLTVDEAATKAGGYVDYTPGEPVIIDCDYRALSDYCRSKGIKPLDLPDEERKQFEIDPPLVYSCEIWDNIEVRDGLESD
ncbi:MAG: hypothetical protein LBD23_18530, partial [Oscillospiraceae bacterium]|nr:hypothetical protein [Oscillospiraceae bacterium]